VEFDSGAMMDIDKTSPQTVALASSAAGRVSSGNAYRIRATIGRLFGCLPNSNLGQLVNKAS
jgi:hypothetical protein